MTDKEKYLLYYQILINMEKQKEDLTDRMDKAWYSLTGPEKDEVVAEAEKLKAEIDTHSEVLNAIERSRSSNG